MRATSSHSDDLISELAQAVDVDVPAVATDGAGTIVSVNQHARDMLPASQQVPIAIADYFDGRDYGFVQRLAEIAVPEGAAARVDVVLPRADGTGRLRVSVLPGPQDGHGVHGLIWHMQPMDVSSGIAYEQANWLQFLADASQTLHASLDLNATLESVVSTSVPFMSDWCSIDLVNPGDSYLRRVAVYHVDPEQARAVYAMRRRYPATRSDHHPVVDVARTGRAVVISQLGNERLRAMTRDDNHHSFIDSLSLCSIMIVPLRTPGGIIGAMTFSTAESGRTYVESDLERAQAYGDMAAQAISNARQHQHAVQVSSFREHYLSVASHEIRTPLAVVGGFATLLTRQLDKPNPDRDTIDMLMDELQRGVDRLEVLTEDLLVASTVQKSSYLDDVQEVDLVELIRTVVDRLIVANPHANGKIVIHADQPVEGFWSSELLDRAFSNLIGNAIKYSPDLLDVRVKVQLDEAGYAVVDVSDMGIGISEEELETLFMPFIRGSNARKTTRGTGLGLYITMQIIERHQGTLDVQSELGTGSTFTVRIPLKHTASREI